MLRPNAPMPMEYYLGLTQNFDQDEDDVFAASPLEPPNGICDDAPVCNGLSPHTQSSLSSEGEGSTPSPSSKLSPFRQYPVFDYRFVFGEIVVKRKSYIPVLNGPKESENGKSYCFSIPHRIARVVIMPTLSSLVTPQVVIMTTCGATSNDKVGVMHNANFVIAVDTTGCHYDKVMTKLA